MKKLTRDEWTNLGIVAIFLGGVYLFASNLNSMIEQVVQAIKSIR